MFTIESDKTINVTRGDVVYFSVSAQDSESNENYIFQAGDIVRFTVYGKKDAENVVLQKDFLVSTPSEEVEIFLDESDTKIGEPISKATVYWYEVELNPDIKPITIIGFDEEGAKIFRLYPEGVVLPEDEESDEEVFVGVDDELDPYSNRPVKNKAIARAVVALNDAITSTQINLERAESEGSSERLRMYNELKGEVSVERSRITKLAQLEKGSTTGDAELQDIRVGFNGNIYESAGEAVRSQLKGIHNDFVKSLEEVHTFRIYADFMSATLQEGVLNTKFKYRVSTDTIMCFDRDIVFKIADGFRIAIHEFKDGSLYADWGWRASEVKVNAGVQFKVMIARSIDYEDLNEVADINEFTNAVTFESKSVAMKEATEQRLYAIDNVKGRYIFETGDIKSETGMDLNVNHHRLRTKGVCYTPEDIVIVANGKYRVYLYTYDAENYSNPNALGWVMAGVSDYTIPAGTYFKLLIAHLDDNDVTYDEIDDVKLSDLYCNLEIYTKAHTERKYSSYSSKSNIESVAHQGYSTTKQYFGNCRLSAVKGAYLKGFDYMEIDIQFAKDGIPVCCHDSTFVDSNDGKTVVTIAEHTVVDLKKFGYYDETIATFAEIMSECKRLGIGLYIDKIENINTDAKWNMVFSVIKNYAMTNKVVWLTYHDKISEWNSKARFALVVHEMNDGWISYAKSIADKGHEVYLNINHASLTVKELNGYNAKLPANVSIGVWTIDDLATYEAYKPFVCAITSNKISDALTNKR